MNRLNIYLGAFVAAVITCPFLLVREAAATGFSPQYDDSKLDRTQTSPVVSYSEILKKATPAVVAVTTKQLVRRGVVDPLENFLRRYYGLPRGNQPRFEEERVPAGIGSGVIVTPQGHIITNAHVITDPRTGTLVEEVTVKLSNKERIRGQDHRFRSID